MSASGNLALIWVAILITCLLISCGITKLEEKKKKFDKPTKTTSEVVKVEYDNNYCVISVTGTITCYEKLKME